MTMLAVNGRVSSLSLSVSVNSPVKTTKYNDCRSKSKSKFLQFLFPEDRFILSIIWRRHQVSNS